MTEPKFNLADELRRGGIGLLAQAVASLRDVVTELNHNRGVWMEMRTDAQWLASMQSRAAAVQPGNVEQPVSPPYTLDCTGVMLAGDHQCSDSCPDSHRSNVELSRRKPICICDPEDVGPMAHGEECPCFVKPKPTALAELREVAGATGANAERHTPSVITESTPSVISTYDLRVFHLSGELDAVSREASEHAAERSRLLDELADTRQQLHTEQERGRKLESELTELKAHHDEWFDRIVNGKGDPEKEAALETIRTCMDGLAELCDEKGAKLTEAERTIARMKAVVETGRKAASLFAPGYHPYVAELHKALLALDSPQPEPFTEVSLEGSSVLGYEAEAPPVSESAPKETARGDEP